MKVTISYLPEEEALAQGLTTMLRGFFKRCKVKSSESHPPRRHIYISVGSKFEK